MVGVEARGRGKPGLGSTRPELEPMLRDCPIVRCTLEDLPERLAELLGDPARCRALGEAGRAYVEREHAHTALARRLVDLYRDPAAGNPIALAGTARDAPHA